MTRRRRGRASREVQREMVTPIGPLRLVAGPRGLRAVLVAGRGRLTGGRAADP